jgi:hypothetical protein
MEPFGSLIRAIRSGGLRARGVSEGGVSFSVRSVYRTNDLRSTLKRQIDQLLGSPLIEEKSYPKY